MINIIQYSNTAVLFLLCLTCTSQNSTKLSGKYSSLIDTQEYYENYVFKDNGTFQYHKGASLGDDFNGEGIYVLKDDFLVLEYFYSKPLEKGYHKSEIWQNNSDSIAITVRIVDFEGNPIKNANVIFPDAKKRNGIKGKIADKYGKVHLALKKGDNNIKIQVSNIGFELYTFKISTAFNQEIMINLAPAGRGTPLLNQTETYSVLEKKSDFLRLEDSTGKEILWKKKNEN